MIGVCLDTRPSASNEPDLFLVVCVARAAHSGQHNSRYMSSGYLCNTKYADPPPDAWHGQRFFRRYPGDLRIEYPDSESALTRCTHTSACLSLLSWDTRCNSHPSLSVFMPLVLDRTQEWGWFLRSPPWGCSSDETMEPLSKGDA